LRYPAAAQFLSTAIPDVIRSYQAALRTVRSPLVMRQEAWPKCRYQAQAIVEDCVVTLNEDQLPNPAEVWRYSHLVGAYRAGQGVAVAESVRAVEILWNAMQPTIRSAVQQEAPARRTSALLLISAAFRSSSGSRLYAGAVGYGEATARASDTLLPNDDDAAGAWEATTAHTAAFAGLSPREKEVLEMVAKAMTNSPPARHNDGDREATSQQHLRKAGRRLPHRRRQQGLRTLLTRTGTRAAAITRVRAAAARAA
jgi:DNA-binding CsgD family transcriptional regulator